MPLLIYRSNTLADCNERALLLYTQGISSEIIEQDTGFALAVADDDAAIAREHLAREQLEERVDRSVGVSPAVHRFAWVAPVTYVVTLLATATAQVISDTHDWITRASLQAVAINAGEWWRLITALTVHANGLHLTGNLLFGALFLYFTAQRLGPGLSLLVVLLATVLAHAVEAMMMPPSQVTIGASTAVFAALGLVAAHGWSGALAKPAKERWMRRGAPLVAGIALLAFLGSGGERTDLVAHLLGFVAGLIMAIGHRALTARHASLLESRLLQLVSAVIAATLLSVAWWKVI